MTADTPESESDAEPGPSAPDDARAGRSILQQVLVASLVGAIILMIAIAAFWTSL